MNHQSLFTLPGATLDDLAEQLAIFSLMIEHGSVVKVLET